MGVSTVVMESHKRTAQVGRLELMETGPRRRWSEDKKLNIVLDSLLAPRQISATAWIATTVGGRTPERSMTNSVPGLAPAQTG